jgi:hypothetical protein
VPVPYTDVGGGGPNPPHGEDFFNRIVNVHWPKKREVGAGSSIFVMGDGDAFACYVGGAKVDSHGKIVPADVVPLGKIIGNEEEPNGIYASSCHVFEDGRTVFVMCGDQFKPSSSDGIIMASTDGLRWTEVFRLVPERNESNITGFAWVFAVVWDGDAFYAAAHKFRQVYAVNADNNSYLAEAREYDVLLMSATGFGWSQISEQSFVIFTGDGGGGMISYGPPPWGSNGLLTPHCSNINGMPDGIQYYSFDPATQKEIFVRPDVLPIADYSGGGFGMGSTGISVLIDIKQGGNVIKSVSSSPGFEVLAVAYSGGVLTAVGGAIVATPDGRGNSQYAVSYDLGDSWVGGSYGGRPPAVTVSGNAP